MKVWLDGQLLEAEHAGVSVADHGLTVGDGVFETMARARRDAVRADPTPRAAGPVGRPARPDACPPPTSCGWPWASCSPPRAATSATARRGCGSRSPAASAPYGSERGDAGPTVLLTVSAGKPWPATADVVVVPWTRNENAPTTGAKTTSYADNVVALAEAHRQGGSEAIFGNTRGELCEGTGSNVFVGIGGRLYTPPLTLGLPGRHHPRAAAGVDRRRPRRRCRWGRWPTADEAFLSSSTRDVQPIRAVDGRVLPGAPGPLTLQAAGSLPTRRQRTSTPERRAGQREVRSQLSGPDQSSSASSTSTSTKSLSPPVGTAV